MTKATADSLCSATADAFTDRHRMAYGERPAAIHTWVDASAILVVARARAAREPLDGCSLQASLARLQHAIVADVYLRTGQLLRPGGRSANLERGLLVLAFECVPSGALVAERRTPLQPLADAS